MKIPKRPTSIPGSRRVSGNMLLETFYLSGKKGPATELQVGVVNPRVPIQEARKLAHEMAEHQRSGIRHEVCPD